MNVLIVVGTRPELIKVSRISHLLGPEGVTFFLNQHFEAAMSRDIAHELNLGPIIFSERTFEALDRCGQVSTGIMTVRDKLQQLRPNVVAVQGDTNSALAGALAASMVGLPVAHVEAGLRSFDVSMPEEVNRRLIAQVAAIHYAPTETARLNLLSEGVDDDAVVVTGNPIVEVVRARAQSILATENPPDDKEPYILATIHRPENTDDERTLRRIVRALAAMRTRVVFVVHPRTRDRLKAYSLDLSSVGIEGLSPMSHSRFTSMLLEAKLVVTDSGGVQEEAEILGVPCVVVRRNTERVEGIQSGASVLTVPNDTLELQDLADRLQLKNRPPSAYPPPSVYGDGSASKRIADSLASLSSS